MTPRQALLDTDTISLIMRRHPVVVAHARAYQAVQHQLTISIMTRFEILRGLKAKRATRQLPSFERFCADNIVLPLTDGIVVRAADLYADLKRRGALIGD